MKCQQCEHENAETARFCARCGAGFEIRIDEDRSAYTTPVAPGTIFEGKYQVLEEIGRGGMGVVYRGHDLSLGRMVAIKVLPEQFNTDDEVIARFKKEARAMAALDHANIVPVYAIGQQRNYHYFVMKFLDGRTVAETLDELRALPEGRFAPADVRRVVVEVCRGLGHAHRRGLIHRDIKPGNIMLSPDGVVTIMDFGIVKEQSGGENLTRTGLVFGTPEYMAPEQAQGQSVPGPSTDLYSLGVVAYEMLSGRPPYQGDTPFSVVLKHIKKPPPPLVDVLPDISIGFQQVIFKSLEKKPEDRYPNADLMREAIEQVNLDPSARPSGGDYDNVGELAGATEPVEIVSERPERAQIARAPRLPSALEDGGPDDALDDAHHSSVRPSLSPSRASGGGFVPVARSDGGSRASEAAVVEDRPGHYRQLVTARSRREQEKSRRRTIVLVVAAALIGATGLALIIFSATRKSNADTNAPAPRAPVTAPAAAPSADPGAPGVTLAPSAAAVSVRIDSEPAGADVFALEGGQERRVGSTPYTAARPRNAPRARFVLRRSGFDDKQVNVDFHETRNLRFQLSATPAL